MKIIPGGISAPRGILACGIHCGIKYKNKDLALIYSQTPAVACGLFTQNRVQAAPLKVTQAHLGNSQAQAVIINSGNANCCTGKQGIADARQVCQVAAEKLGLSADDVLVASTGIIGQRLPLAKIKNKIELLVSKLSKKGADEAAQAILTTDTHPKQIAGQIKIGKSTVNIGAMAKGAGMIHPHLATMLAFITTDIAIEKAALKRALQEAVDNSFNLITVEGDTSTNDMVIALANGQAENRGLRVQDMQVFQRALNFVCLSLAKMIIKDAEGATKFVQVQVEQAQSVAQAKRVAFKVANSPLVKTAINGQNPNWGRIAACVGIADPAIRQEKLTIYLGSIKVMQAGSGLKVNPQRLNRVFRRQQIQLRVILGLGRFSARVYTCDLSQKYVEINAEY